MIVSFRSADGGTAWTEQVNWPSGTPMPQRGEAIVLAHGEVMCEFVRWTTVAGTSATAPRTLTKVMVFVRPGLVAQ